MADLDRRWPAGLGVARDGLRLDHLRDEALFKLQVRGALPDLLGMTPPATGATIAIGGAICAGIAPGEWLLYGRERYVAAVATRVADALADRLHLLTDLTHARAMFELSGHDAADALAAHCPLDLDRRAFPPGAAARSLLGETHVYLSRLDRVEPAFVVIVDQAMAGYATRLLAGRDAR